MRAGSGDEAEISRFRNFCGAGWGRRGRDRVGIGWAWIGWEGIGWGFRSGRFKFGWLLGVAGQDGNEFF